MQQEMESLRKGRRVWMGTLKISWQKLTAREALVSCFFVRLFWFVLVLIWFVFFPFPFGNERFQGGNG